MQPSRTTHTLQHKVCSTGATHSDGVNKLWEEDKELRGVSKKAEVTQEYKAMEAVTGGPFPNIQSKHSLVAKHVSENVWNELKDKTTETSGFTLIQAIACAVEFDNQVNLFISCYC